MQVISFVTFPFVSSTAFAAFECEEVAPGRFFLVADYKIACDSPAHASIAAKAACFLVLHIFVIPLGFLALLVYSRRHPTSGGESQRLRQAMSFLHAPFAAHSFPWEFVETGKKLLLIGFARVMFTPGSLSRLLVAVLISLSSLTFLTLRRPYRSMLDNYLGTAASFSLTCFLLLCMGWEMGDFVEELSASGISAEYQEQFDLRLVIMTVLMGTFTLSGVILLVALFVIEAGQERRRASLLSPKDVKVLHDVCKHSPSIGADTSPISAIERLNRYLEGNKHASDLAELRSGQPENAARGIYHFMRVPDPLDAGREGMEAEIDAFVANVEKMSDEEVIARYRDPWEPKDVTASTLRAKVRDEVAGNFNYVAYETAIEKKYHNGTRDGGRGPVTLDYFVNHSLARAAELSEAHVIALRYYTAHAFKYLNNPLRRVSEFYDKGVPHPLPVIIAYIADGIKKLRAVQSDRPNSLWRGMKNLRVSDEFMAMRRGGTELALMSTTTELSVAAHYGVSGGTLLLKIKVDNVMQIGASLEFLTAFPGEAEICFPPLTYLQPTGRTQDVCIGENYFHVVEVEPHLA